MDPLIQILKRLDEHGVQFVLIGGMAAIAHGSDLVTQDVDVCAPLDDENLGRIIDALRGLNARWRFRPDRVIPIDSIERFRGVKNFYATTDWGDLDVLGDLPGVGPFDSFADKAVVMDVGGLRCRVVDIDTLIAAKRAAGREKDVRGVQSLEAIKKARESSG